MGGILDCTCLRTMEMYSSPLVLASRDEIQVRSVSRVVEINGNCTCLRTMELYRLSSKHTREMNGNCTCLRTMELYRSFLQEQMGMVTTIVLAYTD